MPLPEGTQYRFKKGTKTRLAFDKSGNVIEAKNFSSGKVHSAAEFKADRKVSSAKKQARALRERGKE
jgi:hypothetical protein